jgi:hypothetical protein
MVDLIFFSAELADSPGKFMVPEYFNKNGYLRQVNLADFLVQEPDNPEKHESAGGSSISFISYHNLEVTSFT